MFKIPVYQPSLSGNEKRYVNACLDSSWISSKGEFIGKFQEAFCAYTKIRHARAVCNGTVALQVALAVLEIETGDEVIVPTFTYVASVSTIKERKAVPVFIDSLSDTWVLDPADLKKKITAKTKAIMVPHLYGSACQMDEIMAIAKAHHLKVIEDCAEAFGTFYCGKHVGGFGDISTFSFFGNKTITTGEGGMIATQDPELHHKICKYCNQGLSNTREYWHDTLGFNYRMTNIQAALGLAQIERIDAILKRKQELAHFYEQSLKMTPLQFISIPSDIEGSYWMVSALVQNEAELYELRQHLAAEGIETRPVFPPVHTMPMFVGQKGDFLVAANLSERGLNLPSWLDLNEDQLNFICKAIRQFYQKI